MELQTEEEYVVDPWKSLKESEEKQEKHKREADALRLRLADLEQDLEEANGKKEALRSDLVDAKDELLRIRQTADEKLEQLEVTISEREVQLNKEKLDHAAALEKLAKMAKDHEKLIRHIQEEQHKTGRLNVILSRRATEIQEKEKQIQELNGKIAELNGNVSSLQEEVLWHRERSAAKADSTPADSLPWMSRTFPRQGAAVGERGEDLRASDDVNFVVIGEVGVGKSSFINSFANFMAFNSMAEAEKSEFVYRIPATFTIDALNGSKTISVGKCRNVILEKGESETKGCEVYTFEKDDMAIRVVDTPGLNDSRGIMHDVQTMGKIVDFLAANVHHVHGICFLLKSRTSTLEPQFRYCLQELLANLHESAATNIFFVFTHSRPCNFVSEKDESRLDSMLKSVLAKVGGSTTALSTSNTYYVDNEAFHYIAAKQQSVEIDAKNLWLYNSSWKLSYTACEEMIKKASNLQPHDIQRTVEVKKLRTSSFVLALAFANLGNKLQLTRKNHGLFAKHINYTEKLGNVAGREERRRRIDSQLRSLEQQASALEKQRLTINQRLSLMATFFRNNALVCYNDSIEQQAQRLQATLGDNTNTVEETLSTLKLIQHAATETQPIFDATLHSSDQNVVKDVDIDVLFRSMSGMSEILQGYQDMVVTPSPVHSDRAK